MTDVEACDPSAWTAEQTVIVRDDSVGLRAVIVIDDTTLGPGLGGIRLRHYASLTQAVQECHRLASAMSRKNALADLPYGGAKAVILDGPWIVDRVALMRRFGAFVARTNGSYLPGVDMGTTTDDLAHVAAAGCAVSCSDVDPSKWTAIGVWASIRAAVAHVHGQADLRGMSVLVQGAGHVGSALTRELIRDGATVLVCDVDEGRAASLAAEAGAAAVVAAGAVTTTACDVFAPCAAAGVLDAQAVDALDCQIVAGAANDTLTDPGIAALLHERGITYVPDYVANAGGVIQIHGQRRGWDEAQTMNAVMAIGERVSDLLVEAAGRRIAPQTLAERHAAAIVGSAPLGEGAAR
jgi:leucine dehydrogenase